MSDSRPLDSDLTEEGLEGEGSCPPALDAAAGFTVAPREDQLLVGLLDEDPEEPALDFQTGLMDEGLDLVGEMLVLVGPGQGHVKLEIE